MTAIAEVDYNAVLGGNNDSDITDAVRLSSLYRFHTPRTELTRLSQYSWTWQYCSEFGFYQVADLNNPVNIVSTYYTLAEQQDWCNQMLNNTNPRQPNVTAVDKYGGWDMSPSNVFFSNGECESQPSLTVRTF